MTLVKRAYHSTSGKGRRQTNKYEHAIAIAKAAMIILCMATQTQILQIIEEHWKKRSCAPTIREIARKARIAPSTAHGHVRRLKSAGRLDKIDKVKRSVCIVSDDPSELRRLRVECLRLMTVNQQLTEMMTWTVAMLKSFEELTLSEIREIIDDVRARKDYDGDSPHVAARAAGLIEIKQNRIYLTRLARKIAEALEY